MKHWDSIARAYVEHAVDDTFGPLVEVLKEEAVSPLRGEPTVPPKWFGGCSHCGHGAKSCICSGPPANDNTPRADRKSAYITTYTGRFYPFDPNPDDVRIEDIAHSLAMQCRYAGHGKRFYSVAEHSVHVSRWCVRFGAHTALTALLHDATEAYLVDVPRPVKTHLAGYKDVEASIMAAVIARFGLPPATPPEVHEADNRIIADEMQQNLHEVDPNYTNPLGIELQFWTPARAEREFLAEFEKLRRML